MRETGNFHTPLNIIFRKHTMTYSFDTELAQKLGVNEAILLQNIVFWLLKNKANNSNYYDGRYWTYNSHKAFKELFPFWTENQIRRILESLFEKGVILKGDYNSSPYDKTKWYALSDKYAYLIGLNSQSDMANLPDGDDENARCLIGTDSKLTDIKPDSKQQIVNTDMQSTSPKGSFSFSLSKDTHYDNLSAEYKACLKAEIEALGLSLSHDDFVAALQSKSSYKYKNFVLAYKNWAKKDFNKPKSGVSDRNNLNAKFAGMQDGEVEF